VDRPTLFLEGCPDQFLVGRRGLEAFDDFITQPQLLTIAIPSWNYRFGTVMSVA
jgi:hypothetical protein